MLLPEIMDSPYLAKETSTGEDYICMARAKHLTNGNPVVVLANLSTSAADPNASIYYVEEDKFYEAFEVTGPANYEAPADIATSGYAQVVSEDKASTGTCCSQSCPCSNTAAQSTAPGIPEKSGCECGSELSTGM